jgi:hypothetical protein
MYIDGATIGTLRRSAARIGLDRNDSQVANALA